MTSRRFGKLSAGDLIPTAALALLFCSTPLRADIISTVAGNGVYGFSGDNVLAIETSLAAPQGRTAVDGQGNLYIADTYNNRIRKVDAVTKIITTVAGDGVPGPPTDGVPATQSHLWFPYGVAVDSLGNLYFADRLNQRIRKVDNVTHFITTFAGNGTRGFWGDDGPATDAWLYEPTDVFLDRQGNLYIADCYNYRIRKVDAETRVITTVAGNGSVVFSGDNGLATQAGMFPMTVFVDDGGNMYISDTGNSRIRKVAAGTNIITTVAGNGNNGFSGDGVPATQTALYGPQGVMADWQGNVYIADRDNHRIRSVDAVTQIITTIVGNGTPGFAGDDGPPGQAVVEHPSGIVSDMAGGFFFNDSYSYPRVRWVSTDTTPPVTTISLSGILGENDWYWSDVLVSLTATDNGSGVARTEYSFDVGGTWITYTGPFSVTNESSTVIDYRSVDSGGNVELVKWEEVKIDRIAPLVGSTVPTNGATNVPVGQTIAVTFSENIQQGTNYMNVNLYKGRIDPTKEVAITRNIVGNALFLDPVADLKPGTTYKVVIPAGAVKDMAGHALAADYSPYSFSTSP